MSSDEEDYMSDSFLKKISGKEDIRPGLIKSHAQQYHHRRLVNKLQSDEKNRVRNPSQKEQEAAHLEAGLSKPLDSDNVGFKMLEKLGFKPGSGLGRSGKGRIEPIPVEVKKDRQGLGRESSLKEIAVLRAKYKSEAKEKALNVNDYRMRKAEEAAERVARADLSKSQRVCWELDSKEDWDRPVESWFWPENKLPEDDEDDGNEVEEGGEGKEPDNLVSSSEEISPGTREEEDGSNEDYLDDEFSIQEKLEMLTSYLRKTYFYCVWCGHNFDDEKDLQQECPGPTREDH